MTGLMNNLASVSRRKLLRASFGLVAAPAIIGRADAAFNIFQASSGVVSSPGGVSVPQTIQPQMAKPSGIPRGLNIANPITQGLIFFAIDTGLGAYVILADCFPGHGIFKPLRYNTPGQPGDSSFGTGSLPAVITTRMGTAFNWPGGSNDSKHYDTEDGKACTSYVFDSDALRNAQNLSAQAAGVGYTMGAAHLQNAGGFFPVIFGRCIPEFAPSCFLITAGESLSDVTHRQIAAQWYNGTGTGSSIVSTTNPPLGSFNVSFLTATQTASGNGHITADLTLNGVVEATASNSTMLDTFVSGGGLEQNEGQLNFGGFSHTVANHASNCFGGQVFWGGIWKRALALPERASLYNRPWQLAIW